MRNERICQIVDFAVPADHRVKIKEREKKDKYPNLARKQKTKLWSMKVTVIPIVVGALVSIHKGSVKRQEDMEIRGKVETTQTTKLLSSTKIMRSVLMT